MPTLPVSNLDSLSFLLHLKGLFFFGIKTVSKNGRPNYKPKNHQHSPKQYTRRAPKTTTNEQNK